MEIVKILLAKGSDWKVQNDEGATALHLAAKKMTSKCLSAILKFVASGEVDIQDTCRRTALHWAVACGSVDNIRLLMKSSSSIGTPDVEGKIPLHWAVECRHDNAVDIITMFLAKMPTAVTWSDYTGKTPLHLAVISGSLATVTKLVSSEGCDINAIDNLFQTPLLWAALLGFTEIVRFLCGNGADPERGVLNGGTPLHYAAENNFPDTTAALLGGCGHLVNKLDNNGRSAALWAVCNRALDSVAMLHKFNADLELAGQNGTTALHAAVRLGDIPMVELLLKLEACVDPEDKRGMTPLMFACAMSRPEIVRLLIRSGADIMHMDIDKRSALHWAANGGHQDICAALVDLGLDVNGQDSFGRTPLHFAANKGNADCTWALIQKGANCDELDNDGMTALHWACNNGNVIVVKRLVNYSSNINAMRSKPDRFTPLNLALALEGNSEVVHYMIGQGAVLIENIRELAALKIQAYFRDYLQRKKNLGGERNTVCEANEHTPVNELCIVEERQIPIQHSHLEKTSITKKRYKKRSQRHGIPSRKFLTIETNSIENFHMLAISPELKTIKQKTKRFQSPSNKSDSSFSASDQLSTSFELVDESKKGGTMLGAIPKIGPGLFDKARFKKMLKKRKKSVGKDEKTQDDIDLKASLAADANETMYDEQLLKVLEEQWLDRLNSIQCKSEYI